MLESSPNPAFLVLLGALLLLAFLNPLGSVNQAPIQPNYQEHAFFTGFTQGYNTLDALAALAFGNHCHNNPKHGCNKTC